jgi:hypothetical protein
MERETGIEPATNSLEGCDSTIELLPHPIFDLRLNPRSENFGNEHLLPGSGLPSIVNLKIDNLKSANGGQGRIRTSVDRMGRQIYSLLLLTAQPPVRLFWLQGRGKSRRTVMLRVRDEFV